MTIIIGFTAWTLLSVPLAILTAKVLGFVTRD